MVTRLFPENKENSIKFIKIPSGSFTLDNSYLVSMKQNMNSEMNIKISEFSITDKPITRKTWENVMGKIKFPPWGEDEKCPDCPADKLKYSDMKEFLIQLSVLNAKKENFYRLPSESEIIYLLTLCESKNCKELKNFGHNLQLRFIDKYKNKLGFDFNYLKTDYIQTDDYPWRNYLQSFELKQKEWKDPHPKPDPRFNYGRVLINFQFNEDVILINRLGFTINSLPQNSKVFLYIVKAK